MLVFKVGNEKVTELMDGESGESTTEGTSD